MKPETLAVHAGFESDPQTGAVMPPIVLASTYAQSAPGVHQGYEYSRSDNPTRTPLQSALAELEHARHGLAFSSGLAATDCVLNSLRAGDHILAGDDLYGGTFRLFDKVATHRGLEFSYAPLRDRESIAAALRPNTKLVWFESPTNPMLRLVDIGLVAEVARAHGAKVCVDNTFCSPMVQNPLSLGADLVMHSVTKYLNGHSDVVMGALMTNDTEWYERLKFLQNAVGAVPSPFDCFLVLRGLRTLAVRMRQHLEGAGAVAAWLDGHSGVERVIYPGLPSHPDHALARRQQRGFGGMISVEVRGGLDAATRILQRTRLFKLAESLGGVESLIEHPAIMTHASIPPAQRAALGISDGLIRLSIGIEHPDDLIADLDQAISGPSGH